MNEHLVPDPLDVLRASDPVDPDRLSSASLARIRARVMEDVMTDPVARQAAPRRFLRLGLAAGGVAALALVLIVSRGVPSLGPGGGVGPGSASCVAPYSGPASIVARTFAFDGTVTAIDGETVSFTVNQAYRGTTASSISLNALGMTGNAITSAGGPNLRIGERYLVAGDDHFAWACGYTQSYDAAVAATWAAAAH